MHSFESEFLDKQPVPHSLLRTVRIVGEYRGKEALFLQQTPQVLESLRQVAIIQSTESSNRITELAIATDKRLPVTFRYADLAQACPNVNRPTIMQVLAQLRQQGMVDCLHPSRVLDWEKQGP